jgi:hypothetical protein
MASSRCAFYAFLTSKLCAEPVCGLEAEKRTTTAERKKNSCMQRASVFVRAHGAKQIPTRTAARPPNSTDVLTGAADLPLTVPRLRRYLPVGTVCSLCLINQLFLVMLLTRFNINSISHFNGKELINVNIQSHFQSHFQSHSNLTFNRYSILISTCSHMPYALQPLQAVSVRCEWPYGAYFDKNRTNVSLEMQAFSPWTHDPRCLLSACAHAVVGARGTRADLEGE